MARSYNSAMARSQNPHCPDGEELKFHTVGDGKESKSALSVLARS
jgi:hypothetical protein